MTSFDLPAFNRTLISISMTDKVQLANAETKAETDRTIIVDPFAVLDFVGRNYTELVLSKVTDQVETIFKAALETAMEGSDSTDDIEVNDFVALLVSSSDIERHPFIAAFVAHLRVHMPHVQILHPVHLRIVRSA